ncbi:MAG: biopolymer transporter ExbD [Acidobacteria bacterium]|nr:biopolymer transporter ExbD [Acidobacteriota bacterium]
MAKRQEAQMVADINVTPMVDVMLVMLIIFMVITPMLTKGVQVELVKTKNPIAMADADKEDAILVSVTRNGEVFLGSTKMTADSLPGKVKDLLTNRISKITYLKCDQRSRYERVVEVVDNLRAAGVDQVGLLTESDQKQQEAAAQAPKQGI